MRTVTPEAVRAERLKLSSLLDDWKRINRPTVNKDLRDSLHTKIEETRAYISAMEVQLARAARGRARVSAAG